MRYSSVLIILVSFSAQVRSVQIGGECTVDEQCEGRATICKGRCKCHSGFLELNGACSPAPDKVGQTCSTACKPPLICNSKSRKCECFGGTVRGLRCVKERRNGQSCSSDLDCTEPFTQCLNSRCLCAAYTARRGSSCMPVNQCPDGSRGSRGCRVNFPILDGRRFLENVWNTNQDAFDSCSSGEYCVTYDDNTVHGFCCRATCPLGITPKKRVTPTLALGPEDGYVLETNVGHSYAYTVSCRQPCLDPKPVYTNGDQCMEIKSQLVDCDKDEECEGGVSMECSGRRRRKCQCKLGYQAAENGPGANLVCTKSCPEGQISAGMECIPKVSAGQRCVHDWQCPTNSFCRYGKCLCGGSLQQTGGRCVQPSKPSGGSSSTKAVVPGAGGLGGLGGGNFLETITGLLQGFGVQSGK